MKPIERRPSRRVREKKVEISTPAIEERLLPAIERLLEQGYRFASLSVEQLTKEAGMARGTFYLHFRDKGELVARLMEQVTGELVDSTGAWFNNAEKARRSDLHEALTGVVHTINRHRAIFAAVADIAPHDENVASLLRKMMDAICSRSRHSFSTVKKNGKGRPGSNDDVANVMSWMVVMYCARFVGERSGPELDRLAETMAYICASAAFADSAD